MTYQKVREVLANYHLVLIELDYENDPKLRHLIEMIPQIRVFLDEDRRDKAMRWLGFIQGTLEAKGVYTIEEMANHNKPDEGDILGGPRPDPVVQDQSAEILSAYSRNPNVDPILAAALQEGAAALREQGRLEAIAAAMVPALEDDGV